MRFKPSDLGHDGTTNTSELPKTPKAYHPTPIHYKINAPSHRNGIAHRNKLANVKDKSLFSKGL
eukprot:3784377-Amphidinium_carterae.1